jgi:hypothetical protein
MKDMWVPKQNVIKNSQFPLWDFGECNHHALERIETVLTDLVSQFPLWDFGECNNEVPSALWGLYRSFTLNSLCGISVNATHEFRIDLGQISPDSQFPLWDFFECNKIHLSFKSPR